MKDEQNCYTCKKSSQNCGVNRAVKYDFEPCSKWEGDRMKCEECNLTYTYDDRHCIMCKDNPDRAQPEPDCNQQEELKPCPNETYRHFKGKLYKIICIARNSDNCMEEFVVYESLEKSDYPKGTIWVRNMSDFIDIHRSGVKRFTRHDAGKGNNNTPESFSLLPSDYVQETEEISEYN